jgi:starvation-inducible DNA-binding protein
VESDTIDINSDLKEREKIVEVLHKLLASTYALYLKTQNFHWNVTGLQFHDFHLLFQSQYEELALAIDEMAERIRGLGFFPEGSFKVFAELSIIDDEPGRLEAMKMIKALLRDQETLIHYLREVQFVVKKCDDEVTVDFLITRLSVHEKTAWMLRSIIS